jgi:class 3 adenylate cyclase
VCRTSFILGPLCGDRPAGAPYDAVMASSGSEELAEPTRTADGWLEAVLGAERRGELLTAFDLAERGLDEYPDNVPLRFHAVLVLARTGSTAQAVRRFAELGLSSVDSEDTASLEARLVKDRALAAAGENRLRLARDASSAYRHIRDRTHGYFPAINAATLALVAGDLSEARGLAEDALALVEHSGDTGYYAAATEAEAQLLIGDESRARIALERAGGLHEDDFGALAVTRRQLKLICEITGTDPGVLTPLAGPKVAHFCGHRIAPAGVTGRFLPEQEGVVAELVAQAVQERPTGIAYGSLASGGDILWAEALVAAGCEIHVVLPFALEEFITTSVSDAGNQWEARFHKCLAAATSVTFATDDSYLGDDVLYAYNSKLAMGLALLRSRHLDTEAHQFALWDGEGAIGDAGTAADVAAWQKSGHRSVVIQPSLNTGTGQTIVDDATPPDGSIAATGRRRVVRAMLMGDIRGYSKLNDQQLLTFSELLLGTCAEILNRYDAQIEYRNTWGDAIFVVLSDPEAAARCGLDLRDAVAAFELSKAGLPDHLALRLSGHIGPIFPMVDAVLRQPSFFGSHITRAARMEPVTPPGGFVVTEAFAADLELADCTDIACEYVGHHPAAKDYGRLRMYSVEWRRQGT